LLYSWIFLDFFDLIEIHVLENNVAGPAGGFHHSQTGRQVVGSNVPSSGMDVHASG
jgi:hypothetical protein